MSPGPRKKNSYKQRAGSYEDDSKKNVFHKPRINLESQTEKEKDLTSINSDDTHSDFISSEQKKYTKRSVTSNWNRYEELPPDPFADKMKGKDFNVLLSYSGGSESQLQLQDEKDWDDAVGIDEKHISLDFQNLVHAVKGIPFHKRLNLPADIFNEKQISKFTSSAENWKLSYASVKLPISSEIKLTQQQETIDSGLNIIENYESEETEEVVIKPFTIEKKTENIIESLASCLSLKDLVQDRENTDLKVKLDPPKASDDLDFLLSLSVSSKGIQNKENINENKSSNVDDWLNSIIDD